MLTLILNLYKPNVNSESRTEKERIKKILKLLSMRIQTPTRAPLNLDT